jgi:hypothetical protein
MPPGSNRRNLSNCEWLSESSRETYPGRLATLVHWKCTKNGQDADTTELRRPLNLLQTVEYLSSIHLSLDQHTSAFHPNVSSAH